MEFTFPGGRLRHIAVPATAGNVATNQTPGSGKRWKVLSFRFTLVADVTVANRYLNVCMYSGTEILGTSYNSVVCVASATKRLSGIGGFAPTGAGMSEDAVVWMDPESWILEGTDILKINVAAGVAGDSYSGVFTVLDSPV